MLFRSIGLYGLSPTASTSDFPRTRVGRSEFRSRYVSIRFANPRQAIRIWMFLATRSKPSHHHSVPARGTKHQAPRTKHQAPRTKHQEPVALNADSLSTCNGEVIILPAVQLLMYAIVPKWSRHVSLSSCHSFAVCRFARGR